MKRHWPWLVLLAALWVPGGGQAAPWPEDTLTGGATTVFAEGRNAFSFPFANLPDEERTRFAVGNSFFRRNWVEAPASTQARDGLGPHFIARSCGGCHVQDGRGQPPTRSQGLREEPVSLLMRLSVRDPHNGGVGHHPVYGDQLDNAAVQGVKPEGTFRVTHRPVHGRFADGERFTLMAPRYRFQRLSYGPLGVHVLTSPRVAPHLAGVGLLEAINAADIEENARAQAQTPGPVKGQVNRVLDVSTGQMAVGRFGWKANAPSLLHQTAAAFLGDMGITSRLFPNESCTAVQRDCLAAPSGGQPEIDFETLEDVVFYQATLAPAARRRTDELAVLKGQKLFGQAQCTTCHRPSYVTRGPLFPRLVSAVALGQTIWPYTDLLLHDMGDALADGRPDGLANGRQWKTPPLWGLGLVREVNGHTRFLHDGRARNLSEAILWHGGEAHAAREAYRHMSRPQRDALLAFLESL